ncbi:hypothetical protein R1sor_013594 [Riccia sorocarpa]|uniref:CRAL-TRIO domain-containing protein n=1 Tax=Riccia sorocarpa TaxID=122646 RepID=A0ABD3H714_9MARC
MATSKTAAAPKVEEPAPAPAPTPAAVPAAAPKEVEANGTPAPSTTASNVEAAAKTGEEPKSAPTVTTGEAPKAVDAPVEAKAPEDVTSATEETPKTEETARELPAEAEPTELESAEAAPVEPSIPEFAEESNVVAELKAHEKKSLEEFKLRIEKAITGGEFRPPQKALETKTSTKEAQPKEAVKEVTETPAAPTETSPASDTPAEIPAEEEESKEAAVEKTEEKPTDAPTVEVVAEKAKEAPVPEAEPKPSTTEKSVGVVAPAPAAAPAEAKPVETEKAPETPAAAKETVVETGKAETVVDEKASAAPTEESGLETVTPVFVENVEAAVEAVEAVVETAKEAPAVPVEEPSDASPDEDLSLWGVPLLHTKGDKRTDVILLKFLRARDFNVNQAFKQLKKAIIWRKNFKTDTILEEDFGADLDGVSFMHGVDREGHPVCYNIFETLQQDKELYQKTLGDPAKLAAFIRWRIQVLEKGIKLLNFTPEGPSAMVQIVDIGFFPKDIKNAVSQAADLLQDNYPELVVRKIFVKAPWYFNAMYSILSPFLTQRTKSKLTSAPAGKTTEHLLKFIAADNIPVQYGGLSRINDPDFTGVSAPVTEVPLKTGAKHTVEIPLEAGASVVWDLTVVGYEANYEAEFVPSTEAPYHSLTIEKSKKLAATDLPVRNTFKAPEPGKVVLTIDNSSKKKKILAYRYLVKSEEAVAASS